MLTVTNATKAQVIAVVNAILGVLSAFNVADLTDAQKGSLLVAVNAVMALVVSVTYKQSPKRVPDPVVPVAVVPIADPLPPPPPA